MKSVLVTGAGRGIGKAIALKLAADGWHVYAGVRKTADGEALAEAASGQITPIMLDITSREQIIAAADTLPPTLDAIVNNAGIAINAPVESISSEDLKRQFEVNVFATIAVTQEVMPKIRAARGRVVFISSVSGRVSAPMTGPYSGSKFALEALADAMRLEVKPWGVRVSLIEPTATDTDMWDTMVDEFDATTASHSEDQKQLYDKHFAGMRRTMRFLEKTTVPAATVVKSVEKALTAKRPKARYPVGVSVRIQLIADEITPTPINDFVVSRVTGIPRKR